jgi:hypothetical protein
MPDTVKEIGNFFLQLYLSWFLKMVYITACIPQFMTLILGLIFPIAAKRAYRSSIKSRDSR